jgi:predicted metal-dependent hydrolase
MGIEPPAVYVRELGYRWGSCGHGVNVHWRSVLLPPRYIDYILAHELIHLERPRHDKEFWASLRRVMPDYAARKEWLAQNGGRY